MGGDKDQLDSTGDIWRALGGFLLIFVIVMAIFGPIFMLSFYFGVIS